MTHCKKEDIKTRMIPLMHAESLINQYVNGTIDQPPKISIISLLGNGTYSSVYKIAFEHPSLPHTKLHMACKIMNPENLLKKKIYNSEMSCNMIVRNMVNSQANPHFVICLNSRLSIAGSPIIISELCQGTLHDLIYSNSLTSIAEYSSILLQGIMALYSIVKNGLSHRDLYPKNILYTKMDPGTVYEYQFPDFKKSITISYLIKIADWGIAEPKEQSLFKKGTSILHSYKQLKEKHVTHFKLGRYAYDMISFFFGMLLLTKNKQHIAPIRNYVKRLLKHLIQKNNQFDKQENALLFIIHFILPFRFF